MGLQEEVKDLLRTALQGEGFQDRMTELSDKVWPGEVRTDRGASLVSKYAKSMGTFQAQRRGVWSTPTLTLDPTQQVQTLPKSLMCARHRPGHLATPPTLLLTLGGRLFMLPFLQQGTLRFGEVK